MERSDELRERMLSFYGALSSGDTDFLEEWYSSSPDLRAIGTDPEEWWQGADKLIPVFREQIKAMGGRMPIEAGDPEAFVEGDVGWVADRANVRLPDGNALPLRFTAVFVREDGDWRAVQTHGSVGVGNQDSFGEDLPT